MTPSELFQFIQSEILRIADDDTTSREKVIATYRVLSHFLIAVAEKEQLHFTTLFARISFLTGKYNLHSRLARVLHHFRLGAERLMQAQTSDRESQQLWQTGAYGILRSASQILHTPLSARAATLFSEDIPVLPQQERAGRFCRTARVVVTEHSADEGRMYGYIENSGQQVQLAYREAGRSELFACGLEEAIGLLGLPLTLSLIDSEVGEGELYSPRMIVIEPDYLIDVTAVAECFQASGSNSRLYLISKYLPREVTIPILTGNIVNFFLDELIHDPEASFRELMPRTFQLNPTAFSTLSDKDVYMMSKRCEMHFEQLKKTLEHDFVQLGISATESLIEPSFYAPDFGIQGRLDLYHTRDAGKADIVELKSARPFKPNTYGLSSTHYTQTLLYDLMIRAVHQFEVAPASYILYSSQAMNPMRFAPPVQSLQREAVKLRNEIFLAERRIGRDPSPGELPGITPASFPDARGFVALNVERVHKAIAGLSPLGLKYFSVFTRFVAQEHYLAKVGSHGSDRVNGLASVWLDTLAEKEERFSVFYDLRLASIDVDEIDALITLTKGPDTNALANFRVGDIAVLYADLGVPRSVLRNQIFKCTIIRLSEEQIVIRLRNRQATYHHIESHERWIIEHDLLDTSFNAMHQSLFSLAEHQPGRRRLFLGLDPPRQGASQTRDLLAAEILDRSTREVLLKAIHSRDYFLLWGPPGTGKTSVVLHHLVKYYLTHTRQRILLMAYTNRAVDEICQSLDAIDDDIRDTYLRIGSRYATGPDFTDQLLSSRIRDITSRKKLRDLLQRQRIVVSTISSIAGKPELLQLLKFDLVIVDEASQILEPMLAGMLPRFAKWILIGDHKQLPAVVLQDPQATVLSDDELAQINLRDTRMSYFERMYTHCERIGWDWCLGALYGQGRMHADIMRFPGEHFYGNRLFALPRSSSFERNLHEPLPFDTAELTETKLTALGRHRMLFVPSIRQDVPGWTKTNESEASLVVMLIEQLGMLYRSRHEQPSIGIITPFRAQIANIRTRMIEAGLDASSFTIDTVERYQGSARDIIILSLCVNHPVQLDQVISLSVDGADRKLNVALTRAREQFILVAQPEVIRHNQLYSALIDACETIDITGQ